MNELEIKIEQNKADQRRLKDEQEKLETELANSKVNKLRHGELRIWRQDGINTMTKDLPVVVDLSEPEPHILFLGEHIGPSRVGYAEKTILKLSDSAGYAFDHLTALADDMTEFNRSDMNINAVAGFKFEINGSCLDYNGGKYFSMGLKEVPKLILNLQIVYATMKRQKNAKS